MPRSQDSVPHTMSGLVYSSRVASSCCLEIALWQLMFSRRRFVFLGRSKTEELDDGLLCLLLRLRFDGGETLLELWLVDLGLLARGGENGPEEEMESTPECWRGEKKFVQSNS